MPFCTYNPRGLWVPVGKKAKSLSWGIWPKPLQWLILLKASHIELIHDTITLHTQKMMKDNFLPQRDLNCGPLEHKASVLPMSYADPIRWNN